VVRRLEPLRVVITCLDVFSNHSLPSISISPNTTQALRAERSNLHQSRYQPWRSTSEAVNLQKQGVTHTLDLRRSDRLVTRSGNQTVRKKDPLRVCRNGPGLDQRHSGGLCGEHYAPWESQHPNYGWWNLTPVETEEGSTSPLPPNPAHNLGAKSVTVRPNLTIFG